MAKNLLVINFVPCIQMVMELFNAVFSRKSSGKKKSGMNFKSFMILILVLQKLEKLCSKTSLDELPQILNVLKGEMSLVGPRPYLPREKEMMGHFYNIIISTVPGITGYWQVNGRSDVTFEGRLRMDDWYIRNWSVW